MMRSALDFGAPETEAGGNVADQRACFDAILGGRAANHRNEAQRQGA